MYAAVHMYARMYVCILKPCAHVPEHVQMYVYFMFFLFFFKPCAHVPEHVQMCVWRAYMYVYGRMHIDPRAYVHIIWTTSASLLPAHVVVRRVHVRAVRNEHRRDVAVAVSARNHQRGVALQEESGHT